MLGSAFSLAGSPGVNEDDGSGTFLMAIDPGLLAGKEEFMIRSTELVNNVKSAKPLEGQGVYLPGEQGDARARRAEELGEIEIADKIWQELCVFI
jgi:LDH2 family malate/lactate/ureidoglycolate dehydrogenase